MIITIAEIKSNTTLQQNVDDYQVTPYIRLAEEERIIPCIGQDLYDELDTQINGGGVITR